MLYYSKAKLERTKKARIARRYDLSGKPTIEEKLRQLLRFDLNWLPVLRECLFAAGRDKKTRKFAGAWVMQGLRAQRITPPNNLRALSSLGILKLAETTRSGNRAYYTLVDQKAIKRVLDDFHS
jgi:hypothetical protein